MNEAQTRARLIDPVLREKGWSDTDTTGDFWIPEEVFPGRIDSQGNHRDPGRCDYVLYCGLDRDAIIEAKADGCEFDKGETQARYYAEMLGVRFTYATNGHEVLEIDMETLATRRFPMSDFPTPGELAALGGPDTRSELEKRCVRIPYSRAGGKDRRPYQERAVEAVIRKLGRGEKRALLTLATGTGKTFIAYQLCNKLVEAGWTNGGRLGEKEPTILFITDRNILADQAQGDFHFPDRSCFRYLAGTEKVPMDRKVYFTLFQTLLAKMNPARRAFAEEILKNYVKDGVWSLERATLLNYMKMKYGSVEEALRSLECANANAAVDLFAEFQERIYG